MGELEIVPVHDKRDLKAFLELPYRLYRNDPFWVPPLRIAQKELFDFRKHPFWANAEGQFFLARRNREVVGRVSAILDRNYNRFQGESAGWFGFFECVNDATAAAALLETACNWLRERGAKVIRGPVNPSTNYECGLLVDGFDSSPMIMMTYNPPYYGTLIEGAGFHKGKDLYAYLSSTRAVDGRKAEREAGMAEKSNGVTVRSISLEHFTEDVERLWTVYNSAWARNWGFVPMTRDEFLHSAREMKQILKPDLVLIGEAGGEVVGFALGLPDFNEALKRAGGRLFPFGLLKILYYGRLVTNMRVLALGVVEKYRTAGVAAAFYATFIRNARRLGLDNCEMSWILEDNTLMNRSLEALGAKRYKTYRIYERN